MNKFELSICVVTMNRATQLKEALESCVKCNLPEKTEFVIIDNASTDNTQEVVYDFFKTYKYSFYYEKIAENIGAGKGRNRAFSNADGKYVYMMDDDAYISEECPDFFIDGVNLFEKHSDIATIATQIYDLAWKKNRQEIRGPEYAEGIYKCMMFCGGSHFMRKCYFNSQPYFTNEYGYEELLPSLIAYNEGKVNVFCPYMLAIHNPQLFKWDYTDEKNVILLIKSCAVPYALKKMVYPKLFAPLLKVAYLARCKKILSPYDNAKKKADVMVKDVMREHFVSTRLTFKTVVRMYKDFGLSVF